MVETATRVHSLPTPSSSILDLPANLRVLSLNCWGLKYISKHRNARLAEIGLAILSKWEIEESSMYRYPLNGRPAAFYRGDWFVGKGVATARIRFGEGEKDVAEVFTTHLHAPYEKEPYDSYICHRTAQAWEVAKFMRHAGERGHVVLGLGDFNMLPLSLAHRLIEAHGGMRDIWRIQKPDSALGAWEDGHGRDGKGTNCPSVDWCINEAGATCDSKLNTWRWSKAMRKDLENGKDTTVDLDTEDPRAKRLDYIFFSPGQNSQSGWEVSSARVGMTQRHPELKCSLSDHFSIETTITRTPEPQSTTQRTIKHLPTTTYDQILDMTRKYMERERTQRKLRVGHFFFQLAFSIGCLIGVWWVPHNYVSFILMLLSSVGLSVGVIDGLMGFLFVGSELRALREFEWEIVSARIKAESDIRDGKAVGEGPVRDACLDHQE